MDFLELFVVVVDGDNDSDRDDRHVKGTAGIYFIRKVPGATINVTVN